MIEHPNNRIDIFLQNLRKSDTIYIHPEAEYHPAATLQRIINAGMIPGNAGRMYLPCVGKKITKLLALNCTISGNYGFEYGMKKFRSTKSHRCRQWDFVCKTGWSDGLRHQESVPLRKHPSCDKIQA